MATQHLPTVPLWQIMALGLPMAACGLLLSHVIYASGVGRPVARGHDLESDYRVFFGAENPYLKAFEVNQNTYTKDDNILLVAVLAKGDVFEPFVLAAAMAEPLLVGRLITADGSSTAINISLSLPQKELDEIPKAMAYVSDLVETFSKSHPDIRVATTGMVALNNAFVASSIEDLTFLVPLPVSLAALREQAQIPPRKQSGKSCAIS
ncbi:MAG: hypothetical protein VX741_03225 [Pseudomonadota bacterium]|nr:hypothetical protein [Pseudomonadota bacterium]